MPIRINCPSCKTPNTVDDDKRGRKVRCRKCQEPIAVPAAKKKDPDETAVQEKTKLKAKAAVARSKADDDDDDDEDERPNKKAKKQPAKEGGFPVMLVVGGVGALLLLMLLGGGIGAYFVFRSPPTGDKQEPQAKVENKKDGDGRKPKVENPKGENPPIGENPPNSQPRQPWHSLSKTWKS